jgi:hypothetical protein
MIKLVINKVFSCYLNAITSSIGFFLCLMCFIIFNNSKFKLNFYNYFKMELILIGLDLLLSALATMVDCNDSSIKDYYLTRLYQLIFIAYFKSVLEFCANYFCIFGTVDFYLTISNSKSNIFSKISYRIICFFWFLIGCIIFSFRLFEFTNSIDTSNNKTIYYLAKTQFSETIILKSIHIISFFIRDFMYILILIILNFLIFKKVSDSINKKSYILQNVSSESTAVDVKIKNTRHSVKLMILVGNLNNIFGRLTILINLVLEASVKNYTLDNYGIIFLNISVFAVYSSYLIKFMLYYLTNNYFRDIIKYYYLNLLVYMKLSKK